MHSSRARRTNSRSNAARAALGLRGCESQAAAHLAKLNGWSPAHTSHYLEQALATWNWRSQRDWQLDLHALARYECPAHAERAAPARASRARFGATTSPTT